MAFPSTNLTYPTGKQPSKKVNIRARYSEEGQTYESPDLQHPSEPSGKDFVCFHPKLMALIVKRRFTNTSVQKGSHAPGKVPNQSRISSS